MSKRRPPSKSCFSFFFWRGERQQGPDPLPATAWGGWGEGHHDTPNTPRHFISPGSHPRGTPRPLFRQQSCAKLRPCPLSPPSSSSFLSHKRVHSKFPPFLRCSRQQEPGWLLQLLLLPTWQPAAGTGRAGKGTGRAGGHRPPGPSCSAGTFILIWKVPLGSRNGPGTPAFPRTLPNLAWAPQNRGRARRGALPSGIGTDGQTDTPMCTREMRARSETRARSNAHVERWVHTRARTRCNGQSSTRACARAERRACTQMHGVTRAH